MNTKDDLTRPYAAMKLQVDIYKNWREWYSFKKLLKQVFIV